jgi:hypothetical protein
VTHSRSPESRGRRQRAIPVRSHHPAQPQARGNLHRHCDPHDTRLGLDAPFVRTDLAQGAGLFDQVGGDGLTMGARGADPALDRAWVQAEGHNNGRPGIALADQGKQVRGVLLALEQATDLVDAQVLLTYAFGANSDGGVLLEETELRMWLRAVVQ